MLRRFRSSPHSAGGVKLVAGGDRITMDNTLDERLRLLEDRVRDCFRPFQLVCLTRLLSLTRCSPRFGTTSLAGMKIASSIRSIYTELGRLCILYSVHLWVHGRPLRSEDHAASFLRRASNNILAGTATALYHHLTSLHPLVLFGRRQRIPFASPPSRHLAAIAVQPWLP